MFCMFVSLRAISCLLKFRKPVIPDIRRFSFFRIHSHNLKPKIIQYHLNLNRKMSKPKTDLNVHTSDFLDFLLILFDSIVMQADLLVSRYYKEDKDVKEDVELQAYLNEVSLNGTGPNGGIGRVNMKTKYQAYRVQT